MTALAIEPPGLGANWRIGGTGLGLQVSAAEIQAVTSKITGSEIFFTGTAIAACAFREITGRRWPAKLATRVHPPTDR